MFHTPEQGVERVDQAAGMTLASRKGVRHDLNMATLNLIYPAALQTFGKHMIKGGTESRALLAWFLENYYRLDDVEVYECVCDGHGDKGVDGIYINDPLRQIDIFQSTIVKTPKNEFGDSKLKQFTGAISQFRSSASASGVLKVANPELQAIAKRTNLLARIDDGYQIRGVFVSNGKGDSSVKTYLGTQTDLIVYDEVRLQKEFVTLDKTDPISAKIAFDVSGTPSLLLPIGTDLTMIVAPILASELVGMGGISSGELFAWNVRQWLGKKTTVNKSVAESISDAHEHKYFPAFHNGITILCQSLTPGKDTIEISGYAVVNGCQSLTSLYDHRGSITSDLRIMTKFIKVEHDSDLARKITDHTNNQNGITARDLQSNSLVQLRLQTEIHRQYPEFKYRIKRGEHPEWPKNEIIENELLARIILAFDLDKPEAWSQNYKLFDDLHAEIFGRKEVNADRAIFLYDTYGVILEKLELLDDIIIAQYTLTRWLGLHLVRQAILTDPDGKRLFANPGEFMSSKKGRDRLKECIGQVAQTIFRLLNGALNRKKKEVEYFDYKKEFKSKEFVNALASEIVTNYQIVLDSAHADSFAEKWKATSSKAASPQPAA